MKVRWCSCWCSHRRPIHRIDQIPNTSGRRCQGLRRCGIRQQTPQQPFDPCRGQSPWMKVRTCPSWFHRRPTARRYPSPSTSGRRCQGWRRRANFQQTLQRPFGPFRGQSPWMKVRWCSCCFHRRPTVRRSQFPNTSGCRCRGWHRCGHFQQTLQRPFGPCRGQSRWMEVKVDPRRLHHCPTVRRRLLPNTSGRRCQGWHRCGRLQYPPQQPFGPYRGRWRWKTVLRCGHLR